MLQKINWLGFGGTGMPEALPRAIAELQGFTVSGPLAGVGANTVIAIPGIDPWDTVIKALLFTAGVPSDITANVSIVDRRASATLTLTGVSVGDSVSVNGKTYTFTSAPAITVNLAPNQIGLGVSDAASAQALAIAIMSGDATLTAVANNNVVTVYNSTPGSAGNGAAISAAGSNGHIVASGATLANGSDTTGIKISTATTGNTVILFWFNKDSVPINPPYNRNAVSVGN
jgi:flagellin